MPRVFIFVVVLVAFPPLFSVAQESELPTLGQAKEVCEYVAKNVNALPNIAIKSGYLDVNNDGNVEKIKLSSAGTAHVPIISYEDLDGNKIIVDKQKFEWKDFGFFGSYWLPYKQNYFVGTKSEDGKYPEFVSYITSENKEHWLCSFDVNVNPYLRPTGSVGFLYKKNQKVCDAVTIGALEFVSVNTDMEQVGSTFGGPFNSKIKGVVDVDFDNDGREDRLILVDQSHTGGRGCESSFYSHFNANGVYEEPHPASLLHDLQNLSPDQPYPLRLDNGKAPCRGNHAEWFKFDDKNYLLYKYNREQPVDTNNEIYWVGLIESNKSAKVCNGVFRKREVKIKAYNHALK